MQAEKSVFMAYWAFDPALTTVQADAADSWGQLLKSTAERGITIRVLISDFDPILGFDEHKNAWSNLKSLHELREKLPPAQRDCLQLLCSRHDARVGSLIRFCLQPALRKKLHDLVDPKEFDDEAAQAAPGLWPYLQRRDDRWQLVKTSRIDAYPAAHHEKLCVIDNRIAYFGGLDLNSRRLDNQDHQDERPWHDIACQVDGPLAAQFSAHFEARWNRERRDVLQRLDQLIEYGKALGLDTSLLTTQTATTPCDQSDQEPQTTSNDPDRAKDDQAFSTPILKPLRTISEQAKSSFSRTPSPVETTILTAYEHVIDAADQFIYIETQFLRSSRIVDALVRAKQRSDRLKLIVLIPMLPERMWDDDNPNPASRHGHYLQAQALQRLKQIYQDDFGAFTLMRNMDQDAYQLREPSQLEHDHIYVHAKTIIVDDEYAIIGSANLNDRSLFTDTETAVAWHDPKGVPAYRHALFEHAVGPEKATVEPDRILSSWRAIARDNYGKTGRLHDRFIVPYPIIARDYAVRKSRLIPDRLV